MANILMNLSLAKMPFLGEKLKESSIPMMYIYGLLDNKAQKISQKNLTPICFGATMQ